MNKAPAQPSEHRPAPEAKGAPKAQGYVDDPEDGLLVERAVKGEAEAFEALFAKHRQRLFAVAWRLMRDEDAALDVVQEAFVRAYQNLGDLRGEARFYPWLRRIAVNLAIDRLRHIKRGTEVGFDEAQFGRGEEADESRVARTNDRAERESPSRRAELSEFGRDLQGALEKLSEAHRAVFMLHAAEGMSYREIADALGCNIGTVMSRLFYARKKLQELLAPHLDGKAEQ
ncbi:MAG: sigma-70 family RNA polymerase sigma factor [Planctomycetes bacterium]|nr:sigma-70 family RNA polymerase sigma factor [Planctomycetota bacterium]